MMLETEAKAERVDRIEKLLSLINFTPWPEQRDILLSDKRYILVSGGEQAGKSITAATYLFLHTFDTDYPGLFWLVAADYERTRAEFEYLQEDYSKIGILKFVSKRIDPGRIILADGTRIETKSARDPRTIAMRAPDGVLACEASQLDLITFERLRGRTAPRRGWLFLSGTMEGSLGWYPQLIKAWQAPGTDQQSYFLPTWTNRTLYPGGRDDPEIKKLERESSDSFFMERIAGQPVPPSGLVFGEIRADIHVRDVKWVKGASVELWVDPGYAGAYAVEAVQEINGQIQVFDEVYEQGLITSQIIDICKTRRWWQDVNAGAIDIAGTQHQAMPAPTEVWLHNAGLALSSRKVRINEGIERLKGFLKPDPLTNYPKIVFNPSNQGVLSEFGLAPSPFDGQTRVYSWKTDREGNIIGQTPEDRNNHGIKALIYGIVARYGYGPIGKRGIIKVRRF